MDFIDRYYRLLEENTNYKSLLNNYNSKYKEELTWIAGTYVDVTPLYEYDKGRYMSNVSKEFISKGRIDLRNVNLESADDVASLARIVRSTQFESFRVLYVKDDTIIGSEFLSSKIPDEAPIIHNKLNIDRESDRAIYYYTSKLKRLGADGYYILHNHPSGFVSFNSVDKATTLFFKDNIDGFIGHIIVGIDKALFVDENLKVYEVDIDNDELAYSDDRLMNGADDAIEIFQSYVNNKDCTYIIYTTPQYKALGLEELPNKAFNDKNIFNYISNRKSELGGSQAFLYTSDKDIFEKSEIEVKFNLLADAFLDEGKRDVLSARSDLQDTPNIQDYNSLGKLRKDMKIHKG